MVPKFFVLALLTFFYLQPTAMFAEGLGFILLHCFLQGFLEGMLGCRPVFQFGPKKIDYLILQTYETFK